MIRDGSVAVIRRKRKDELYYLFPGGQVEAGELPEMTAVREAKEELGLEIKILRIIADVEHNDRIQRYYLAEIAGGQFGNGAGEEMMGGRGPAAGTYEAVWLPVAELSSLPVRPVPLALMVKRSPTDGWPDAVVDLSD